MRGQLRALATLDVKIPPGAPRFPLREMLKTAQAVRYAKHPISNIADNEELYHDVMFSIGDGAGTKFNVDIQSEFALLPNASIQSEPVADALADLGHASSAFTPRPHAAPIDPSCDPAEFFDESMHDAEVPDASEPPGATPDATLSAALTELNRLRDALKNALSYGAGTNAQGKNV